MHDYMESPTTETIQLYFYSHILVAIVITTIRSRRLFRKYPLSLCVIELEFELE